MTDQSAGLHRPRTEGVRRRRQVGRRCLRSERQCLLRLPQTPAVVFAIHADLMRMEDPTSARREGLALAGL